jgi:hypothetical protein
MGRDPAQRGFDEKTTRVRQQRAPRRHAGFRTDPTVYPTAWAEHRVL